MNVLSQTLDLWKLEALVVLSVLAGSLLIYYISKVWNTGNPTLVGMLGASLLIAFGLFYVVPAQLLSHVSTRAMLFVVLYIWCALWTVFLTWTQPERIRLLISLIAQAIVIYALYYYT